MTSAVGTSNSIVGQYGAMPIDMLIRKQEQTCMYENPHLVEDNLRSLLRDFTPDTPFLASDEARGGNDEYGNERGGYQSDQVINLRSGARTLTDPYLPDGTFLDHQFTELDPRGVALEPNMRKHVEQQYSRGKFIKHYDDSDNSIPESGVTPWEMQMNIRNAQNVTKDYFKIFETSKDNWHNGGMAPGYTGSNKEKLIEGQEIKDPVQALNRNRIDITNNLSNDTSIGWRRTTDHRFKVAKYGKTNTSKSLTSEDWFKNRSNTYVDHDVYVSWQDNNMSKSTALLMMDLSKQKEMTQFTGLNGINFSESTQHKNKQQKLTPADMAGMLNRPTEETRSVDAHTILKGEQKPTSGEKLKIHDVKNIEKTYINPTIVEKMSNINRQAKKETKDDLRSDIQKSANDKGVYMIENNKKKNVLKVDPSSLWNTVSVYKKGKSLSVKNYKAAATKIEEGGKKLEKISKNIDFQESYTGNQRRGKLDITQNQNINTSHIDNDYGREVERSHLVGPMGSKYMNSYMDIDTDHNDINDTDRSYGV
jgi:hypothetical protein